MRLLGLLATLVVALTVTATSGAAVRKAAFTATAKAGTDASLTIVVKPRARCTITVVYDTVTSRAKGLKAKTGTRITWRWRVGSNTHAGRWPVTVNCGKAGKLTLRLRVIPR